MVVVNVIVVGCCRQCWLNTYRLHVLTTSLLSTKSEIFVHVTTLPARLKVRHALWYVKREQRVVTLDHDVTNLVEFRNLCGRHKSR